MYIWLFVILIGEYWAMELHPDSTQRAKVRSDFDYDSFNAHQTPNFDLTNKEFWDQIYQNSMLNTKTKYNSLSGDKVCFTCPIDRNIFTSLYHEALSSAAKEANNDPSTSHSSGTPPRVTISWATQINENRVIFFCRNNTRIATSPVYLSLGHVDSSSSGDSAGMNAIHDTDSGELEYSCENNNLCLLNVKKSYPISYQCFVKSYILNVKLNVIVQLQYVLLYFTGDSVKFDYQKEVQVYEGQPFVVKCEVPETNPISSVNAYIDNQELKLTGLDKKTIDNRMTINTFSFEVNASRLMNGKRVKCEAFMRDLPSEIATQIDLRSRLSKEYTLSVYYLPTCLYKDRVYRTGINRSIVIECPINGSNPDVTYYKMIPPSTRTKVELIDNDLASLKKIGRYKIYPSSVADFGLYECIPRSLAGTTKCDIHVELGSTPNPPEQCMVQFAQVNNKTFAQFSCRPGFNQGGSISFLSIYELVNKELKLSGRVNIDENKFDKEVPYITPVDPSSYYEYVIMQENNYGNSTSILLTLGEPSDLKAHPMMETKNVYVVGGSIVGILFFLFVCGSCCCSDLCVSVKSDNFCCKCCPGSSPSKNPYDESLSYKKAPLDSDPSTSSHLNHQIYTSVFASNPNEPSKFSTKSSNQKDNSTFEYYDNNASYNSLLLKSTPQAKNGGMAASRASNKYYRPSHREYLDDEDDNHYFNDNEDLDHKTSSSSPYSAAYSKNNVNEYAYNQSEDDYDGTGHYESERDNLFAHAVASKIDNPNLNKLTGSGLDSINNPDRGKFRYNQQQSMSSNLPNKKSSYNLEHSKIMDADFQSELSMKLKSIRKYDGPMDASSPSENPSGVGELLYSQNYKAIAVDEGGMTATVASSEMQIKLTNGKPGDNKTNQVSSSSASSSCSSNSNCDLILKDGAKSQSNYSLIKTTLNGKPPILKPKPRNNIYQSSTTTPTKQQSDSGNETGNGGGATAATSNSNSNKHSINSPSTSVTDVSSSNTCTPQHMPHKETGSKHITPSLNNPNNVTTTFGLKTFSHNSNNYYDNLTIRSKKGSNMIGANTTLERRNQHVKNSEC